MKPPTDGQMKQDPEQPQQPQPQQSQAEQPQKAEEYDYTAQTLLQAPLESEAKVRGARMGLGRQKSQEKNTRKNNNKPMIAFIAIVCFTLSYAIANIFYQYSSGNSAIGLQQILSFYQRENIFLSIVLIAVTSSIAIAVLALLIRLGKKLFQTQSRDQNQAQNYGSKSSPTSARQNSPDFENPNNMSGSQRSANMARQNQEQNTQKLHKHNSLQQGNYESPKDSENLPDSTGPEALGASEASKDLEDLEDLKYMEYMGTMGNTQFYSNLNLLLKKKTLYLLQSLLVIFSCIFFSFMCLVFLAFSPNITRLPGLAFLAMSFVLFGLLLFGILGILLRNQYVQGIESLLQSTLQQVYQHSSPTNSYSQLNAVNMLYALAFVESKLTQARVITEFQNILKLTRSSWYQAKYASSPSILVEEVLRKLISTVDFHRFVEMQQKQGARVRRKPSQNSSKVFAASLQRLFAGGIAEFVQKSLIYLLFLRDFQDLRAFRDHESVSLLSQMSAIPQSSQISQAEIFPDKHKFFQNTNKKHILPKFILENYYLVGINLAKLRVKEAHFQNCQLSHSTWVNSELSDCSISSSRLDQAILSQSSWRRFLWHGNISRELDIENCFYLQGNIQQCNLQAIQNQARSTLQHCLLQECDLSHSTFRIDAWQSVTASDCNWYEAWISLGREIYAAQDCVEAALLKNKLQIKQNA